MSGRMQPPALPANGEHLMLLPVVIKIEIQIDAAGHQRIAAPPGFTALDTALLLTTCVTNLLSEHKNKSTLYGVSDYGTTTRPATEESADNGNGGSTSDE